MEPLISIITVVYNDHIGLEATIKSVMVQSYPNVQYIVIDGNSLDGTKHVAETHNNFIDIFVSEPDLGVYDAMNKGLKYVKGDLVNFLNSGDEYSSPDVLKDVSKYFNPKFSYLFGNIYLNDKIKVQNDLFSRLGKINMICHQSIFFNVSKLGLNALKYNINYKLCSDMDLLLKLNEIDQNNGLKVPVEICNYQKGGLSDQLIEVRLKERSTIINERLKSSNYQFFVNKLIGLYLKVKFKLY